MALTRTSLFFPSTLIFFGNLLSTTTQLGMSSFTATKPFPSLQQANEHAVNQALLFQQENVNHSLTLTKCGNLACQHDSFQKTLTDARILSLAEYHEEPTGKKKKNNSKTCGYAIVLSNSIFFPEGGGQPCDQGTLTICTKEDDISPQVKLRVVEAKNEKSVCVLNCQAPTSSNDFDLPMLHNVLTMEASTRASKVRVKQELDWERRFDLMTQHSAQHLISAEASNIFGIATHSFSLQLQGESYIDLVVNPKVTLEENKDSITNLENVVNERIRENEQMKPKWLDPEDEEFKTKVRSRLLPDGLTGKIRVVEIDNIDCNTCCGTHVPSLGHLQMIKFFKMTQVKPTIVRVWFAAGSRLLNIIQDSYERQEQITSRLSCNPQEHVSRVEQLVQDKRAKEKEIKSLHERLRVLQATEIVAQCESYQGVAVVNLGSSDADMKYMSQLSSAVLNQLASSSSLSSKAPVLLLFVQGEKDHGTFLLSGSNAAMVASIGKCVAQELGGRGGGKNGRYQGKGTRIETGLSEAKRLMMEAVATQS